MLAKSAILEHLFTSFPEEEQEIHNIAHVCLFVLATHRDLKSQMLNYACNKNASTPAVALVELGADVNTGLTTDTPLAHACRHHNIALIRKLLSKHVLDLTIALRIALELSYDDIVGMLLSYVAQNQHRSAVNFNCLDLPDLKAEWLLPVLSGNGKLYFEIEYRV